MTASTDLVARRLGELVAMKSGRVAIDVGFFAPAAKQALATIRALKADKAALVEALERIVRVGDWNNYVPDLRNIARDTLAKHGS